MLMLVTRSMQRVRLGLAALGGVLVVFQITIVAVAASIEASGSFERIAALVPGFLTRSVGPSLLTLASFKAMAIGGYLHPVIVLIVTQFAIYTASEPAGDVEVALVDLILARPLPRHVLVTRSLTLMILATATLVVGMAVATLVGLAAFAPAGAAWPAPRTVMVLGAELLILACAFGSASLAAAAFARRRSTVIVTVGIAAVALYLLDFVGASWAPAAPFAPLSPFHYYDGTAVLAGRGDVARDVAVLGTMIIAATALAYWQFARRDL